MNTINNLKNQPLNYYPRPNLERIHTFNYLLLNGTWNYTIIKKKDFNPSDLTSYSYDKEILVPYPIESTASGVKYSLQKDDVLIYQLKVKYDFNKPITLLHIDASDAVTNVYVNDNYLGESHQGYLPIEYDISRFIKPNEEFTLYVVVQDMMDERFPHGKQSNNPGGIWYTKVSGIWKSVWLESVDECYIKNILFTSHIKENKVNYQIKLNHHIDNPNLNFLVKIGDIVVLEFDTNTLEGSFIIPSNHLHYWSPDKPNLYDVEITFNGETLWSYFAYREIEIKDYQNFKAIYLNGEPIYLHGLLDQGYYPEGIYTPSSLSQVESDLKCVKALGFNTLRKHIKVEDDMWYYLCDSLGIMVIQDMINNNKYSLLNDTILPMIGIKKNKLKGINYPKGSKALFINNAIDTINHLKFYPSIIMWTIFNEGWGEFNKPNVYERLKELDNTRIFDTNSGWNYHEHNEINSEHIYFKKIKIKKFDHTKPLILTEFGGYSLSIKDHTFSNKEFGYKKFKTLDEYNQAFLKLYEDEIIPSLSQGLVGSIYTQLTDVEEEINGIMTYDRQVIKLNQELAVKISKQLKL